MSRLALSPRPARPAARRFAALSARPDQLAIDAAIIAIEDALRGDRMLDAQIYRALGWEVLFDRDGIRRGWRCRSPHAASWMPLPKPSTREDDAAALVPHGWSRMSGTLNRRPFAWTAARHPVREGVPFFECHGASPALALCKAAMFAHRWYAIQEPGR